MNITAERIKILIERYEKMTEWATERANDANYEGSRSYCEGAKDAYESVVLDLAKLLGQVIEQKGVNTMIRKVYWIENTNALEDALEKITNTFPCFIDRELVEMNFSEIGIFARVEDIIGIENILAPLV